MFSMAHFVFWELTHVVFPKKDQQLGCPYMLLMGPSVLGSADDPQGLALYSDLQLGVSCTVRSLCGEHQALGDPSGCVLCPILLRPHVLWIEVSDLIPWTMSFALGLQWGPHVVPSALPLPAYMVGAEVPVLTPLCVFCP
jgi:hypothetical protein